MNLGALLERELIVPFATSGTGGKIPWNEPAFSARMLREHLSQQHDRASRRFETIDRHVAWIHQTGCDGQRGRSLLDLGCGPGFYAARLAQLGHSCVGIDFSPASIEYARAAAVGQNLRCDYRLQDLRNADFGSGFDVVLLLSGELNAFAPADARAILAKAHHALRAGGRAIVEVHTESFVRALSAGGHSWYAARQSVFSD